MIKIIKRILFKLVSILDKIDKSQNKKKTPHAIAVAKWFEIKGDETLRLNYALNENSIVFDVGGYKGEFAMEIYCKFNSNVFIFEPVPEFHEKIIDRFINNPKVRKFNFGLANKNFNTPINLEDNSSSLYKKGSNSIEIEIRSFNEFIKEHDIYKIDLIKINIEGSEYELLESIIEAGNITKLKNIQVQFHDFVNNASERMKLIQAELSKTHRLTYQYEFVWENWELIEQ